MVESERDIIMGYLYEIKRWGFKENEEMEGEKRSLEEIERVVVAMKFMADEEEIAMRFNSFGVLEKARAQGF